ncbi:MAG: HU family DNA-binding protein [Prevotellaceae bacterium]|jgi:predicted histone-like DNA-binding protein|nr:HU family DNA-binding protein [Prevotellaceae bacterium]
MAIFYNKIERGNPMDTQAPKKWYAVLKNVGMIGEKEVAKLVSDETTINRKEAEMALDQFEKIMVRLLLDGHSVQLGDLGSFYLTCNSEGVATKEELTATNIKNLNIRFTPGKEVKEAIQHATFKDLETLAKK